MQWQREKNPCLCWEPNPSHPAHNLVTILTDLSQLSFNILTASNCQQSWFKAVYIVSCTIFYFFLWGYVSILRSQFFFFSYHGLGPKVCCDLQLHLNQWTCLTFGTTPWTGGTNPPKGLHFHRKMWDLIPRSQRSSGLTLRDRCDRNALLITPIIVIAQLV
jgi:hypothetical protein